MLFFLVYLFIETLVSVNIASSLGGLYTFIEIIISAFAGIIFFRNVGFSNISKLKEVQNGTIGAEDAARDSVFKMLGALFLILPGFFSDFVGLAFQLSAINTLVAKYLFQTKNRQRRENEKNDTVIDVEVLDDSSDINNTIRR